MKKQIFVLFLFVVFASCSSEKPDDSLPCIDVTKVYPEKEIILTDIADVTFLCLNSDNDDYLYRGLISCVTKNTIVVSERNSGKILLFSKDGSPKSQFNNIGQGPEEYTNAHKVIYDEETDEVFVYSMSGGIMVYSSAGEYKRKINLPEEFASNLISFFDNESLFLSDDFQFILRNKREVTEESDYPVQFYNHPYIRISRTDGKVLNYVKIPSNDTELVFYVEGDRKAQIITTRVIHTKKGFFLCNLETDTVFLYDKDKVLTPVICKTPLVKDLDPMIVMNNCLDYGGYQFMDIVTVQYTPGLAPAYPIKRLMRNKKTGEVFSQKISLPDYKGKDFLIGNGTSRSYEEGVFIELELTELKQAFLENRLSGKLKELVETLDEDEDNNVFMFVDFK